MNIIHNPNGLPESELPIIYGFNNGASRMGFHGALIAQDGTVLGGHVCSSESFMPGDLGVTNGREHRHASFREHYPDGYRMEFVSYDDVDDHAGLQQAFKKNEALDNQ